MSLHNGIMLSNYSAGNEEKRGNESTKKKGAYFRSLYYTHSVKISGTITPFQTPLKELNIVHQDKVNSNF